MQTDILVISSYRRENDFFRLGVDTFLSRCVGIRLIGLECMEIKFYFCGMLWIGTTLAPACSESR